MPLNVEIQINGHWLETVWITRMSRLENHNDAYEYIVGVGSRSEPPWRDDADERNYAHFYHVYSDGARVCVEKGLAALRAHQR